MIRVAIEIDGVLRDTYIKLEKIYKNFLIDELELVDDALEPIISNVPDEAPEAKPFSFDKKPALFFGLSIMFK